MNKSQKQNTMNFEKRVLREAINRLTEADIGDKKIENPETGNDIKISSAWGYDDQHPAKKKAKKVVKKAKEKGQDVDTSSFDDGDGKDYDVDSEVGQKLGDTLDDGKVSGSNYKEFEKAFSDKDSEEVIDYAEKVQDAAEAWRKEEMSDEEFAKTIGTDEADPRRAANAVQDYVDGKTAESMKDSSVNIHGGDADESIADETGMDSSDLNQVDAMAQDAGGFEDFDERDHADAFEYAIKKGIDDPTALRNMAKKSQEVWDSHDEVEDQYDGYEEYAKDVHNTDDPGDTVDHSKMATGLETAAEALEGVDDEEIEKAKQELQQDHYSPPASYKNLVREIYLS